MIAIILPILALRCAHPQIWTFDIDATTSTPISPYIYGANSPDWSKTNVPFLLARQGGNRMTAYNWTNNASNAGNDWHNQSDDYLGASDEPGWTVRTFMEPAQAHGAAVLLTVPTAGYVAADKNGGGDVNQTPDYIHVRFRPSYARKPGKLVYPPDPNAKVVYQDEFVAWVEKIKSPRTPVWFDLDNEPDLWGSTHSRIWLKNPTFAQIIANNIEFGSAIKEVAPDTLVFGPVNYGWNGFRTFQDAPDAKGRDFLDTYLSAMQDAERQYHKRLLDVLDVHWYPEAKGDGVRIATDNDKPGTPAARIQAPRSLWDPTYIETSWITESLGSKPINLLPRLFGQIRAHYPGTKLSISEYNYGGSKVISGAIAQADVLGIFGRYGLFAACNWGISPGDVSENAAFRAFLNCDGQSTRFGDEELPVAGESAAQNSLYAALDSRDPQKLTAVAINKTDSAEPVSLNLHGFNPSRANAFAITSDHMSTPAKTGCEVSGSSVRLTIPAESVTTVIVRS